jgi:dolichol-phosphate mannosyltransferase
MKNLSIIIPAYKEIENLDLLLPQIYNETESLNIDYEVLVVDSNEFCELTNNLCSKFRNFKYINRSPKNNYGDAVRSGIRESSGEYIIFMDADGSHTPSFLKILYDNRNKGDIVIASRYTEGGKTDNGMLLIFMSFVVNKLYSFILNLDVKDVSNSFKLYKSSHLKKLNLDCENFDIVEEVLYKCKLNFPTIKFIEIPYTFKKRIHGSTKRNLFLFVITFAVTLFKLRFSQKK